MAEESPKEWGLSLGNPKPSLNLQHIPACSIEAVTATRITVPLQQGLGTIQSERTYRNTHPRVEIIAANNTAA
jgi:hypothetical protein